MAGNIVADVIDDDSRMLLSAVNGACRLPVNGLFIWAPVRPLGEGAGGFGESAEDSSAGCTRGDPRSRSASSSSLSESSESTTVIPRTATFMLRLAFATPSPQVCITHSAAAPAHLHCVPCERLYWRRATPPAITMAAKKARKQREAVPATLGPDLSEVPDVGMLIVAKAFRRNA
jgi:hypothetical protein